MINYKKINELLKDLPNLGNKFKKVHEEKTQERGGYEDSYDKRFEVYDAKLDDGYFIKVSYITDSYGENENISGIEFVKGKEKVVTVYEF